MAARTSFFDLISLSLCVMCWCKLLLICWATHMQPITSAHNTTMSAHCASTAVHLASRSEAWSSAAASTSSFSFALRAASVAQVAVHADVAEMAAADNSTPPEISVARTDKVPSSHCKGTHVTS